MLHYVLSNSKGKYCMNNVIMCMSILVDIFNYIQFTPINSVLA